MPATGSGRCIASSIRDRKPAGARASSLGCIQLAWEHRQEAGDPDHSPTPITGPWFDHAPPSLLRWAEMALGEVQEHPPIIRGHGVFPFPDVVAEAAVHELALRWHFLRSQTFDPE